MSAAEELAELAEELKCDQCGKHLSCSPVLLSSGGENVCGRCQAPVHAQHTFTRNNAYEKVATAARIPFPCKNRDLGCTERLLMSQAQHHEERCPFNDAQRISCPASTAPDTCSWTGALPDLEAHYRAAHSELIATHPYTVKQEFHQETTSSLLMMLHGFAFLVQLKCADGKLWQSVRLLGQACLAKLFHFHVRFGNRGHACIEETKQVANSNNFVIENENSASNVFKCLLNLLGDYEDINFKLRVTMRDVECCKCKKKLERAPIYPALEEGSYSCADCHQEDTGQASSITGHSKICDIRLGEIRVKCSECAMELEWTPAVPGGSAGPLCPRCHAAAQSTRAWGTCEYRDSGCQYGSGDLRLLDRHWLWRCSYSDWGCGRCKARNTGRDTRKMDHLLQEHCTQLTPAFTADSATVTATVTVGTGRRTYFKSNISTVWFLLQIHTIADCVNMYLTADTECWACDVLTCKYKIASTNSLHEINDEFVILKLCDDWSSKSIINKFPHKSKINITLTLSAINK